LLSLIKRLLQRLFRREEEKPRYTKEQFIEAVKELSKDPVWRARILKDALTKIKEQHTFNTKWIDRELVTKQTIHRGFGCGISYSFGDGIYALSLEDWIKVIDSLLQDSITYTKSLIDCDNYATFFKGFADFIIGKPVVIYATGLVFRPVEQYGQKVCICKSDYLIGGHAWNRIVTTEPIDVEKVGSTELLHFDFTVYNYEPQNDKFGDKIIGNWCYQSGGGLPIIYGKKVEGGEK